MNLFETGLDLLIKHLKSLPDRQSLRLDRSVLDRIEKILATEGPVEAQSLTADSEERPEFARTVGGRGSVVAGAEKPVKEQAATTERRPPEAPTGETNSLERRMKFEELRAGVLQCTKCPHLVAFRHSVVFGVGNADAELMFVGEAPGADEDLRGEPFVGRAGELLTRIIQTMGFEREDVYIANVLKCRPDVPAGKSGNRPPTPEEMQTCLPYLRNQIELIQPTVLVALGSVAIRGLLGNTEPMKSLRGRWLSFGSIPLMVTFHPSYLLRNQALSEKRKVWEDMLQVLERLSRPISERQRNYFLGK
jgi:uracil-DNA glycosylase family 4